MTITVDGATKVITVPQADCTLVSGTIYTVDTDAVIFTALKDWSDSEDGMNWPIPYRHATEVAVAGVTYARVIEIINGYTMTFTPDSAWSVTLQGSNNNMFDVLNGILNQNNVQVIPTNSAGLQTVVSGSGVTAQDKLDIADQVWKEILADHAGDAGSTAEALDNVSAGASPATIAAAVWNHVKALTLGKWLGLR